MRSKCQIYELERIFLNIISCFLICTGLKDTAEELVKKKMETNAGLTPWEKFLEKKKEKKRKKKEEKKQTTKEVCDKR